MHTIFLGIGSNIGNKEENIQKAISLLRGKVIDITVAALYETKPMYFEDQDTFINTVLRGLTELSPKELLIFVKDVEKSVGRIKRFQNGPREIDIDILFYDDLVYKDDTLEIPHPRITERDFVLIPFKDISPEFIHPILKKPIKDINS